jgi:UDP-N-acetyl-D-galactosamine dehydrogenase
VLGLTYKEDVPDIRYSRAAEIVAELRSSGVDVQVHDPLASADDAKRQYGIALVPADALLPADAVILAVPHDAFVRDGWTFVAGLLKDRAGLVMDIKAKLDAGAAPEAVDLWRL